MKTPHFTAAAGLDLLAGLVFSAVSAYAGEVVISNFDDPPTDAALWSYETWSSEAVIEADSALDAGGGAAGSGSLRVACNFPNNPGGYSQSVITGNLGGTVDAETLYTNVSLDIKLDPGSYPRVDGVNYGYFEVILRNGNNWDWTDLGGVELTASHTNWTHLSFPVKAPADAIHHLTLKLGENNLTNTVLYNVDNIRWAEASVALPSPTLSVGKTVPGLNLLAASGGQYDRQNIVTVAPDSFGWIGSSTPVSYSMSIKSFPSGATYGGFTTHFYLVPGTPGTEEYPDWNEANCILVDIRANADESGTMTFHYKTNAPGSNGAATLDGKSSQYFNTQATNGPVGQLGSVTGASILGTWTLTLSQDTQITLTAPDGSSTNLVMPSEDATLFAGGITVYFGAVPGQTANIGQAAILNRVQIKAGAAVVLDDDFTVSPLNPDTWVVRAASAAGVTLITPAEPYFVSWTTPASGFILQTNAVLSATSSWGDAGLTDQLVGTRRRVLVPSSSLPAQGQGYFRLIKP
jgi:hypothetical protein